MDIMNMKNYLLKYVCIFYYIIMFIFFRFNPYYVKVLSSLLVTGQILQEVYQPYETHLDYMLQFMVDNNLFGMDFLYTNTIIVYKIIYSFIVSISSSYSWMC